jgi:hypothetical protein
VVRLSSDAGIPREIRSIVRGICAYGRHAPLGAFLRSETLNHIKEVKSLILTVCCF